MTKPALEALRTDPEYSTPGKSRALIDVFRERYLLKLLINKGTATRYYGSVLGWLWSYVRPGAQFLMYFLVIGVILGANRGIDAYPIHLFCGIVAVNLFSEVLKNTTLAITDNKPLVRKIYLPRELFPVSACGVALIHFLPQALILLVVVLILGWTFSIAAVGAFLLGVFMIIVFGLGLGLFFGAINALYRDAKNIVDIILMFSTWASPVLYSWHMVRDMAPDWLFHIYMSNPITGAVEMFHEAFWAPMVHHSDRPEHLWTYVLIGLGLMVFTLVVGQLVFKKLEGEFAQRL